MAARLALLTRVFDRGDLERMVEHALTVLERTPFRVQGTDEFYDEVRAFGCTVEGEMVGFPKRVIDEVMGRIRASSTEPGAGSSGSGSVIDETAARAAAARPEPPEPTVSDPVSAFTHGQALHICDTHSNQIRPAVVSDLERWCRMVDSFGDVSRAHPTFIPTDVPRESADLTTYATIALHSAEPHRVSVYSARMIEHFLAVQEVISGTREAACRDAAFATKCWVNSPFMITRENVEIGLQARRLMGRPVEFGLMPVAGASCPVTVAGSVVQNTAESLGVCALSLALGGGLRGITGASALLDLRHVGQRQSGPDMWIHRVAEADMQEHLFGTRPTVSITGVSAQTVSAQSVFERSQQAALNLAAGARSFGIGCLSYSDIGSAVQLILDRELVHGLAHMLRDVSTDDEHLGVETILATVARGAAFMDTEHTARFYREETWLSGLIDPRPPLAWAASPTDMIDEARGRAVEVERTAVSRCPLREEQRRRIRDLVSDARSVAAP